MSESLKDSQDAHGHMMYDHLKGKGGYEVVERDDGYFDAGDGPKAYFSQYDDWPEIQREAMKHVRGKVLDIGCGAGRHALYLQEHGFDVVGIDISPLAVETCRLRGLKNVHVLPVSLVSSRLGTFDTVLMMGNNFGLFGSPNRARWLLRRFDEFTSEDGRIVAEMLDPHKTETPEHLEYHKRNKRRGRMPGQVRIRVRYRKYVTPWFDYLFVSEEEMKNVLVGTGWKIREIIGGQGPAYVAVIDKEHSVTASDKSSRPRRK